MSQDEFLPCKLSEYKGEYSLLYVRFEDDLFRYAEERGGQGGGYSLEAMVNAAMALEGITLPDVRFDCESSMFVVRGDKPALRVIAELIRRLLSDGAFAEKAITYSISKGEFD